jgi:2-polyprenyl-3-methyl-5-hydroxy-6-metoxy-1,4-benzoquinol methylase
VEVPAAGTAGILSTKNMFINNLSISRSESNFEEIYIASRQSESRIYTDEQVAQLPSINLNHIHYDEWQARKRSSDRLKNYLGNKNRALSILEIGCGNGWLTAKLAVLKNSTVTGIDINRIELSQARRVFSGMANINFKSGGLKDIPEDKKFDIIVFAASVQYFPSFERVIRDAFPFLNDGGEIHILDSHFYYPNELESAKKRSLAYYHSTGCDEMADFYFHHSYDSLNGFRYKIIFNPYSLKNKMFRKNDPFPWICIKES